MPENIRSQSTKTRGPRPLRPFDDEDMDYFQDFNAKSVEEKIDHFLDSIRCYNLMRMHEPPEIRADMWPDMWPVFVRDMRYRVRDWEYMLKIVAQELALHDAPGSELKGGD